MCSHLPWNTMCVHLYIYVIVYRIYPIADINFILYNQSVKKGTTSASYINTTHISATSKTVYYMQKHYCGPQHTQRMEVP